jgi:hypothetical protein
MRRHPKTFDGLFTNMIAAGEAGGILDTILKRLAVYIEKNVKLQGQVKSAMIYPTAVIIIAAVIVAVEEGRGGQQLQVRSRQRRVAVRGAEPRVALSPRAFAEQLAPSFERRSHHGHSRQHHTPVR